MVNEQYCMEKIQELEKQVMLKDEFVFLIVHDLKTPLAVITSALQTMDLVCKDQMPEKAHKFLNTIKQNTNRQIRLVNNLLEITRMNAANTKLNKRNCDIVFITQSIINSVQMYAIQKNIKLVFISKFRSKVISIDEEKYERSLLNLLSNAIKFTQEGKSVNVLLAAKKYKNKNMISVSVQDEGIGIPKDKQHVIFERFGQSNTMLSRQSEGTGLGLHLVKLFINALDGVVTLKSEEGKGSIFTIYLPITKSQEIDETTEYKEIKSQFADSNNRIIEAAAIEFSNF